VRDLGSTSHAVIDYQRQLRQVNLHNALLLLLVLQVCWDFYNASKHGVAVLEAQAACLTIQPQAFNYPKNFWKFIKPASVQCSVKTLQQLSALPAAGGWSWQQWAAFLQDPLQYKVPELQVAARQLGVQCKRSKAELVMGILQAFGLQEPSRVSPQLLRAVLLERCCECPWEGCEVVVGVWTALTNVGIPFLDHKYPGLGAIAMNNTTRSAAARRKTLLKHFGACRRQQLLQLQTEMLQWARELHPASFAAVEAARARQPV
jgi:hypothetical protein